MTLRAQAENHDTSGSQFEYDRAPDFCPICHMGISPRRVAAAFKAGFFGGLLQIVHRCPRQECDSLFIAYYRQNHSHGVARSSIYHLYDLAPVTPAAEVFGETISTTSPFFVQIYNQAAAAEALKLDQVAGMGYRKALEFLIKDFLINRRPADAEAIKTTMLGACINNSVDDPRIKSVASRATWLGNDETHYVRKFADRDVEDMKRLVKLTVNWIESVLLTEEYEANMSKHGAQAQPAGGNNP